MEPQILLSPSKASHWTRLAKELAACTPAIARVVFEFGNKGVVEGFLGKQQTSGLRVKGLGYKVQIIECKAYGIACQRFRIWGAGVAGVVVASWVGL